MEHHIAVKFADDQEYDFTLHDADTADLTWEQAQQWIDEEYVNTGYQADYPVGMTLLVDKVLRIAITYGPQPFANGPHGQNGSRVAPAGRSARSISPWTLRTGSSASSGIRGHGGKDQGGHRE